MVKVRFALLLGLVTAVLFPPDLLHLPEVLALEGPAASAIWMTRPGTRPAPGDQPGARQDADPANSGQAGEALLRVQIGRALGRQAAALKAGDLAMFLSVADPGAAALRQQLSQRFTSLRALRVAGWDESLAGGISPAGAGSWRVPVRLRYCFVVAGCAAVPITVDTGWSLSAHGQALLIAFGSSTPGQTGPRPWEVSELRTLVGERTVVATTSRWAGRLPGLLSAAERAARVADKFARWDDPPGRYVVFLAGPEEWPRWYGSRQSSWVAASAMALTDTYTEIVLNGPRVAAGDLREVLQHEFTHVVTLAGVRRTYPGSWWLVEGIAEYVQNYGQPITAYRSLADGWRYARSGWNGTIALDQPSRVASLAEANGRYAVAYLAVRRLVERFGEARMLRFFAAVARNGTGLEAAARSTLGLSWAQVSSDCRASVRWHLGIVGFVSPSREAGP